MHNLLRQQQHNILESTSHQFYRHYSCYVHGQLYVSKACNTFGSTQVLKKNPSISITFSKRSKDFLFRVNIFCNFPKRKRALSTSVDLFLNLVNKLQNFMLLCTRFRGLLLLQILKIRAECVLLVLELSHYPSR